MQLVERIVCWKPRAFDDFKSEVYPGIFEMETSPFRHGPPGCEDVIRSMFERIGSKLLELMSASLSAETDPLKLEADLYILGQFVESLMVDLDHGNKVFFEDLICCSFDPCSHFTLRFCHLLFSVCCTFRTTS